VFLILPLNNRVARNVKNVITSSLAVCEAFHWNHQKKKPEATSCSLDVQHTDWKHCLD